jgi:hypothetical protein
MGTVFPKDLSFLCSIKLSSVSVASRGHLECIFSRARNSGKPEVFFAVSTKQQSRLKYSISLINETPKKKTGPEKKEAYKL